MPKYFDVSLRSAVTSIVSTVLSLGKQHGTKYESPNDRFLAEQMNDAWETGFSECLRFFVCGITRSERIVRLLKKEVSLISTAQERARLVGIDGALAEQALHIGNQATELSRIQADYDAAVEFIRERQLRSSFDEWKHERSETRALAK